jgi:hypothetical protein
MRKKYQNKFSEKTFGFVSRNTKKIIAWTLRKKDPMIEKFNHDYKKLKNKNSKIIIEFKNERCFFFKKKNTFYPIFWKQFFLNLNLNRLYINEILNRKKFYRKIGIKNFVMVFSNFTFFSKMLFFSSKKKNNPINIEKKKKRILFFYNYYVNQKIFYNFKQYNQLLKNVCIYSKNISFVFLKKIIFILQKTKKKLKFKKIFSFFQINKDSFLKKFFSFMFKIFFTFNNFKKFFLEKKDANFFLSFYWFIFRAEKKTGYFSQKTTNSFLIDLISYNKKGDLVISCSLINFEFLKNIENRALFLYFSLENLIYYFFSLKNSNFFRKIFIIKNLILIMKNYMEKQIFFSFYKTGIFFWIFFLKFIWKKKKF